MPLPSEKRIQFFVYVVESPSDVDLYHGRNESELLRQAIGLNQTPCVARTAISREAFNAAIKIGLPEAMASNPGRIPILHISAHGNADGIGFSNGEIITWDELRHVLAPVNQALQGSLLVCMSSCEGYSGSRMAMYPGEAALPFYAIIGNCGKPTWSEAAIAFAVFYHQVARGNFLPDAVSAMRTASGNESFMLTTAEESLRSYVEYLKGLNPESAQQQLQQEAQAEPQNHLTKLIVQSREQPA